VFLVTGIGIARLLRVKLKGLALFAKNSHLGCFLDAKSPLGFDSRSEKIKKEAHKSVLLFW